MSRLPLPQKPSTDDVAVIEPGSGAARPAAARRYHHGALKEALIAAAEALLADVGVDGFSLRECARRAGVSPAAPAHHFGDAAGLLTEVAIRGFERLGSALAASEGEADPDRRIHAQGIAYVGFARAHPGPFKLLFRKDKVRSGDERLDRAGRAAFVQLEAAVSGVHEAAGRDRGSPAARADVIAAWSLVHGFAYLALDGRLAHMACGQDEAAFEREMLPLVLRHLPRATDGG